MQNQLSIVLEWCSQSLGPCSVVRDDTRVHRRSTVLRLETTNGCCFLKWHHDRASWERELHGYEKWAPVFEEYVPTLVAVRDQKPYAFVVSELLGEIMSTVDMPRVREAAVWYHAGKHLAKLHRLAVGPFFGPCTRDGSPAEGAVDDPVVHVVQGFDQWLRTAEQQGSLDDEEVSLMRSAREMASVLAGEKPVPCYRDYGPDNWMVLDNRWTGAVDFEFSQWDVPMVDFCRYPNWEWMDKPCVVDAMLSGYGPSLTERQEQQCVVLRAQYALGAIVWGREHAFAGFETEGHRAIRCLRPRLA